MTDTTQAEPLWTLMVIAGAPQYTDAAISDVLAQSVPTKLLLIGQGLDSDYRRHLEQIAEHNDERVFCWFFDPALSLSAAWNRGLNFIWEVGGKNALVVNNDVRLHPKTYEVLRSAMGHHDGFVSGVGVTEEQFDIAADVSGIDFTARGGPDFSCFLINEAGHKTYEFDENFQPAFCEDLDMHRRWLLDGNGAHIFSVNMPYLHFSSQTLKTMEPEQRAQVERQISGRSRAYYEKKWGGPVNGERFTIPFDAETAQDGVTTPELQRAG